jgi:hypothetical protein
MRVQFEERRKRQLAGGNPRNSPSASYTLPASDTTKLRANREAEITEHSASSFGTEFILVLTEQRRMSRASNGFSSSETAATFVIPGSPEGGCRHSPSPVSAANPLSSSPRFSSETVPK